MSTYQHLRQRLRAVHRIKQITQAMEVVAAVKYRKFHEKMEHYRAYKKYLSEIFDILNASMEQHPSNQIQSEQIGVVVISGDRGLSGSYNSRIFKEAETFLNSHEKNITLFLLGNKAIEYFQKRKWPIEEKIPDYTTFFSEEQTAHLSKQWTTLFEAGKFKEIWVIYTQYQTLFRKQVKVEKLLPQEGAKETAAHASAWILEPKLKTLYPSFFSQFFAATVHMSILEAYVSEQSERMLAMQAAKKNSDEMIEKLTLMKNKNRQLNITKEILEIIAGAENLNE